MAPARPDTVNYSGLPHPSFIQVAKPYVFEHAIEKCLQDTGVSQTREDNVRLSGVLWIDNVRKALKLPVRTFDTAVVYYHKYRLIHPDTEYSYVDAAAAALFTACKIEDTLKKSRDILAAAYNLKVTPTEHLSPDDSVKPHSPKDPKPGPNPLALVQVFEHHSRTIIGLERLMLEASGFDFRNRHPQQLVVKLAKQYDLQRGSAVAKTAYQICIDIYRTFAPLKQTTATMAFACLELSSRLHRADLGAVETGEDYRTWKITRAMVMETLLDLLELYTHHRLLTIVGPTFAPEAFLSVRIPLNSETESLRLPRHTNWRSHKNPNHLSPHSPTTNGVTNGVGGSSSSQTSPREPHSANSNSVTDNSPTAQMNPTSMNGTRAPRGGDKMTPAVRFMLSAEREREEKKVVGEYFKVEEELVEVPFGAVGIGVGVEERERENYPRENHYHRERHERERERERPDRERGDRDRDRDRDRSDKDRDRDRDRERDRDRDRDRDRYR